MKKIILLLVAICLLFVTACNSSPKYIEIRSQDDLYDSEHTHLPTSEDIRSIKNGMRMNEVIEILGLPHAPGPTSGMNTLTWFTDSNNALVLTLFSPDEHLNQCAQRTGEWASVECMYNCWTVGRPVAYSDLQ